MATSASASQPVARSGRCGSACAGRIATISPRMTIISRSALRNQPMFFVSTSSRADTGSRNSVRMPGPSNPHSIRFRPASVPTTTNSGRKGPTAELREEARNSNATALRGTTASW